jgi:predicted small integral membrane protein
MEKYNLRYIKIGMVGSIALFFTLIAYNNMVDYQTNWVFVQHLLSMDTTFKAPVMMWRAITNPTLQACAYSLIIVWQVMTAAMCWAGCVRLSQGKKRTAYLGLFMGFLLYVVGFIVIGGEWFNMWQSPTSNGQMAAGLFASMIMFVMLFLQGPEQ